jgi:hypothetical protein
MAGADYAFKWLVNKGYAPHQAAGIVGNLVQESGVNPTVAPGDNGTAFGIAQWRGPRLDALRNYASANGQDWRSMDAQLGFLHNELGTTEKRAGDALRASTDVQGATKAIIGYERPQGWSIDKPEAGHGWNNRLGEASRLAGQPVDLAATAAPLPSPVQALGDRLGGGMPVPDPKAAMHSIAQQYMVDQEDQAKQRTAMSQAETARRRALFSGGAGDGLAALYG